MPTNRLIHATSPYLLQHAHNPVDWYPWGEEALNRAKQENRLIFLSIGYSACHWCHVMEEESFGDPRVGEILAAGFISIKVDREERPDLDSHFMERIIAMTGSGGWPLNLFLTPDLDLVFGGTYWPPQPRHHLPAFTDLLVTLARQWEQHRAWTLDRVAALRQQLDQSLVRQVPVGRGKSQDPRPHSARYWLNRWDDTWGGFGDQPKFPQAPVLMFLLREAFRNRDQSMGQAVLMTLDQMAMGGVRDQLAGAFHRYAVDRQWQVPHFEIMLTDNALLARVYLEAFQYSGESRYARVARAVLDDLLDRFLLPDGAFASSLDADSQGREGVYYTWTPDEVKAVLGLEQGEAFIRYWLNPHAGLEDDRAVLHLMQARQPQHLPALWDRFDASRQQLLQARQQRVPPGLDDKVLTSWNSLMISALARAGAILAEPRYLAAARQALQALHDPLCHSRRGMRTGREVFLEDHAFLILALLDLYEATFQPADLTRATTLALEMLDFYLPTPDEPFTMTPRHQPSPLPSRRVLEDDALPSANAAALVGLLRLADHTGNQLFRQTAENLLARLSGTLQERGPAVVGLLEAWDDLNHAGVLAVLAGPRDHPVGQALVSEIHRHYLPGLRLSWPDPPHHAQQPVNGLPTVYLCMHQRCLPPIQEVAHLASVLREETGFQQK